MKRTTGEIFYVYVVGDPSVGIFGGIERVNFNDGIYWDEDMVQDMKKILSDWYDVPVSAVYTQMEWNEYLEAEKKWIEEMVEATKEAEKEEREWIEHLENCAGCSLCEG